MIGPSQTDTSLIIIASYIGGGCLEGGSGNTSSFLQTAMLLLACHPHVQEKAQKELDDVIGKDRLPSSEDYEKLPYVRAIIREVSF